MIKKLGDLKSKNQTFNLLGGKNRLLVMGHHQLAFIEKLTGSLPALKTVGASVGP